ncbi:lectin [Pseudomonas syringae]|nr:lectin [Pseudomonas syringae]EPM44302.1 lectin repeat domain protein [Pseudomonas syringae pv. actinidiae ICMP 19098]EPN15416.1 lectin repeat domain protein [Pseudomonas syringae pv. actinidiae ICMP 19100]EPN23840.1 lectin repeat domain protein [Pseudomonas syringae pv. actinidiae ICMP 19099]EPN31465.1 lectin repeat domain protein [Pseudomonas syringae pv. actinidiae ICMP 18883]EPN40027.1 lectin repeat domain protein [Pseudomonas syringae pv. actinidiae ICMP 19095]
MKKIPAFIGLSFLPFFCPTAFSAEMNPYEKIISTASGEQVCLTLDSESDAVSLLKCVNTDHQQWIFVSSGPMLYIKNKALGESAQAMCLSASKLSRVSMKTCASTDSNDYQSLRLWSRDGDNPSLLSNKYVEDLGFDNYLLNNGTAQLVFGKAEAALSKWIITQPLYEEIISTARGTDACLSLADDMTSVVLQKCLGRDSQQWIFTPNGTMLYVKNKLLATSAQEMCLFAANSNSVKMAACASADSNDYPSKRLWRRDGNNPSVLSNKYIGDLGEANYLNSSASGQPIFGSKEDGSASWSIAKRYGYIRNVEKGQETCLALSPDEVNVEFSPCKSVVGQDWRMSFITSGYDKLTNRALLDRDAEKCLGPDSKIVNCQGTGYTSQRSWSHSRNFVSPADGFTLANKYRNDLAGGNMVLGFAGNTIQMVPESRSNAVTWNFELAVPKIPRRPVAGDRKVLLLHTQYSDKPATDFAEVQRGFFGSPGDNRSFVNAVNLSSDKNLHFTGDAVTGLDLGPRPSDCPYTELRNQAVYLARQKGFDAIKYDYVAVEIPDTSCSWAGVAAKPGSWAMGNGVGWKPWMWQHEFGHSLGGPHAKSLERCPYDNREVVQIGGSGCAITAAGDPSDTLNGGGSRLYPIPYLYYAGWLTDEQFPEALKNGTYKIAPLFREANATVVKGLRLFRSDGSYLTLELRKPSPGFESWAADDPFVNGVIVRIAGFSGNSVSNTLVDTTPGSSDGMKDAPLKQGMSVDDVLSGKRITLDHIDEAGATIEISDIPDRFLEWDSEVVED